MKSGMKSDVDMFNCYWNQVSTELYRYLLRRIGSNDAEDVMQSIACLAYEKIRIFRNKDYLDFKRWVYGVASNKIMKWYSKKKKTSNLLELYGLVNNSDTIIDSLILRERKEALSASLSMLSTEEKRLIELRNFNELSYNEIAKITGKSTSALMSKHPRVLKKLLYLISNMKKTKKRMQVFSFKWDVYRYKMR